MAILTQFKSSFASGQFVFADGTTAIFMQHIYRTADKKKIAELEEAVAAGHPQITGGEEIDTEQENPLAGLRAKLRAEFLAELAQQGANAVNPQNNMGGTQDINANFGALSSGNVSATAKASLHASHGNGAKLIPVVKGNGA